jgi:hypothetical protein
MPEQVDPLSSEELFRNIPDEVFAQIARGLSPEEIARARCSCLTLAACFPKIRVVRGCDSQVSGPYDGDVPRSPYINAFDIHHNIERIDISCRWGDQGWGNRKGSLITQLLRKNNSSSSEYTVIDETSEPLGLAPHERTPASGNLDRGCAVVANSRAGDQIRVRFSTPNVFC